MDAEEIHINGNGEMNMNDVENRSNSIVGIHALLSKGARVNAKSMVAVAATALMVGFVLPAYAQQAPAPASGAQDAAKVDEIVVTGALRRQRLQDAPVAVTSLPPTEFTHSGFKSAADLQFISPSVQVSIGGANAIYIRGSGTNNTNGSGEQSVGLVIDGVPMGFVDDIGGDISDRGLPGTAGHSVRSEHLGRHRGHADQKSADRRHVDGPAPVLWRAQRHVQLRHPEYPSGRHLCRAADGVIPA
jgi:hypothetical protein